MDEVPVVSGGRGRGRGGGIAVLPAGMWDSLNGTSDKKVDLDIPKAVDENDDRFDERDHNDGGHTRSSRDSYNDAKETGADRGRGLEKDLRGKDWDCPSCTNHNWSWRTNCNMCGAPKPMALVSENEQRDGAGGGFNERQDRASAATVEIDEEGFDDFGRRVKKLKRADRQAKEEAALKRLNEKYRHLIPSELETILTEKPATSAQMPSQNSSSSIHDAGDRRRDPGSDTRQHYSSNNRGSSGRDRSRSRERDRENNNYRGGGRSDDYHRRDDRYSNSSNNNNSGGYGRSNDDRRGGGSSYSDSNRYGGSGSGSSRGSGRDYR